ncbi:hypothetical protein FRB96_006011 [Tulasnella sp. 330]|nr:hypothetical protein FRB96_006011 [Tulasnella sp. 330]
MRRPETYVTENLCVSQNASILSPRERVHKNCKIASSNSRLEKLRNLSSGSSYPPNGSTGNSQASRTPPSPQSGSSHGGSSSGHSHNGSGSSSSGAQGYFYPGTNMVWFTPGSRPQPPTQLTPHLRNNLINLFFQHREKCFFEVQIARFNVALRTPPDNLDALDPALVTAILLLGCYWSRAASLVALEAQLLDQTKYELSASLVEADRLHDYVRGTNLLVFYYICKGMYDEAEQQICNSARVAIACGMHQIVSSIYQPPTPSTPKGPLRPPRDNIDLGERIHTLWQTFNLDKMVSLIKMSPAYLLGGGPDVNPILVIDTPWPRLMIEYETANLSQMERQSVQDLYNLTSAFGLRPETLVGLEAQGLSLAQRAISHEFAALDAAIQSFIGRLPGLRNGGESGQILATPGHSPINHRLVFIHTLGYTASLQLHQHMRDATSHSRCNIAAQNLTMIVSELTQADYGSLSIGLGVSGTLVAAYLYAKSALTSSKLQHMWVIAGRILVTLTARMSGGVAQQFQSFAMRVLTGLKQLNLVYPPLGKQLLTITRPHTLTLEYPNNPQASRLINYI